MDDDKRHILLVDTEEMRRLLHERGLWEQMIDDPTIRNNIYMQEKAKREQKAENRKRMKQAEIDKQRRREQFIASKNYRQSVDYIHNVLGWNNDNNQVQLPEVHSE